MAQFKRSLVAFLGMAALIGLISVLTPVRSQGQGGNGNQPPQSVNVLNTPTVNVGNTPSVNVVNQPTVNLPAGTSVGVDPAQNTVRVGNAPDNPVSVRDVNDARQPFYTKLDCVETTSDRAQLTMGVVPLGKRLVVENVSVRASVPEGESEGIFDLIIFKNNLGDFYVRPLSVVAARGVDPLSGRQLVGNQVTRIYADPGATIEMHMNLFENSGPARLCGAIDGHLVDVP